MHDDLSIAVQKTKRNVAERQKPLLTKRTQEPEKEPAPTKANNDESAKVEGTDNHA